VNRREKRGSRRRAYKNHDHDLRREYNQEIVRRILCNSLEYAGYRDLVYVGPHHEVDDD